MKSNWRQVRIFTSDFSDQWYYGLLVSFAVPFAAKYPETPFWFTRYTGNRNQPKDDTADTQIADLKPPYLDPSQNHLSMRFRFCPISDEEAFLEALFTPKFWCSGFLPFNALAQFSGGRFGCATDIDARVRRATVVARLLHSNCLYVLDVLQEHSGTWRFEPNSDGLNWITSNSFQTMVHLMAQVMDKSANVPLPLFWQDPNNASQFIPVSMT